MPELVIDQPSISLALVSAARPSSEGELQLTTCPSLPWPSSSSVLVQIGGYISIFGLGTYVVKETLYLSEPLLAVVFGIISELI